MTPDSEKTSRPWIAWLVGSIWAGTTIAVLIATSIHPATTVDVSVNARKISFQTNASHILGPSNEEQLLVSGVSSLRIQFNIPQMVTSSGASRHVASLQATGDSFSSCSFYRVRSSGFEVRGPAVITLEVFDVLNARSFSLKAHGPLNDNLSSRPSEHGLMAGFECRGVRINGGPAGDVEGRFSPEGGDSTFIATPPDARLDFLLAGNPDISDTQIPIFNEVRFSEIYPGASDEKSVLLKSAEIFFEKVNKKISVVPGNLLVVVPKRNFYLRQFSIKNGVDLSLHGSVRDVRAGPGAKNLASLMPSAFEQLSSGMRIYGTIPALVALLLGILEKMGALGKK